MSNATSTKERTQAAAHSPIGTFRATRKTIIKELRSAIRQVNLLLAQALDAGVKMTVQVEGHPRYDMGVYGGDVDERVVAEWGLRLEAFASRHPHPKGGTPYGAVAYCDWRPSHA